MCYPALLLTIGFHVLPKLKSLYRVEVNSLEYHLVRLLFWRLAYLRYLAFYGCESETSKVLMRMVKLEKEKRITYEVYDGKEIETASSIDRFVPVKIFESFES